VSSLDAMELQKFNSKGRQMEIDIDKLKHDIIDRANIGDAPQVFK
jgi:hypothetical protein